MCSRLIKFYNAYHVGWCAFIPKPYTSPVPVVFRDLDALDVFRRSIIEGSWVQSWVVVWTSLPNYGDLFTWDAEG